MEMVLEYFNFWFHFSFSFRFNPSSNGNGAGIYPDAQGTKYIRGFNPSSNGNGAGIMEIYNNDSNILLFQSFF